MQWFTTFLAEMLMLPYVGWGVYTLRRRYHHHDDLSLPFEAWTMLAVGVSFILEASLLRVWGTRQPVLYLFALLGLCMATIALYGHVAISLVSRLLVDMVLGTDEGDSSQPRFGPAESLERQRDYEGAMQEYMVLARVFPSNPAVLCRVGENMARLGRYREAVPWFERALRHLDSANRAGAVATRLAGVLHRHLDNTEAARTVLEDYMARFPGTPDAEAARAFLAEMQPREQHELSEQLAALAEEEPSPPPPKPEPIKEPLPEPANDPAVTTTLTALEAAPIHDPVEEEPPPPPVSPPAPHQCTLVSLDAPITDDAEVDAWDDLVQDDTGKPRLTLEALEEPPPEIPARGPKKATPRSSLIEPLDPGEANHR